MEIIIIHLFKWPHEIKCKVKVKVNLLLLYSAFTIIQYSRALYNSITPSAQACIFFSFWAYYTACSLTVGVADGFIAVITEVPILHLGEVLYLRYWVFPGGHPSW